MNKKSQLGWLNVKEIDATFPISIAPFSNHLKSNLSQLPFKYSFFVISTLYEELLQIGGTVRKSRRGENVRPRLKLPKYGA